MPGLARQQQRDRERGRDHRDSGDADMYNLALVGRLLVAAALCREESRGGHYRADFPATDPAWEKHIIVQREPAA